MIQVTHSSIDDVQTVRACWPQSID